MSSRLVAARRIRTVAATAVVTAVAGAVLVPATASAADGASGSPLTMTLGSPTPSGPLKRGGETESMLLTVTNSSTRAQKFAAWLPGDPVGPSPLLKDSVAFDVTAVDAPATKSAVGRQDGNWQGLFFPASGTPASSFSVPAKTTFTWKVTVGLGANYPTNDGGFKIMADPIDGDVDADPARNTVVFKTDPQITPGKLNVSWEKKGGAVARPGQRAALVLNTTATGPGEFPAELRRTVSAQGLMVDFDGDPDFVLETEIDGKIVKLKETEPNMWELPTIAKGFGAPSGTDSVKLYLSLGKNTDIKKDTVVPLEALYSMEDAWGFNGAETQVKAGPAQGTSSSPSASPSTEPSSSPSASDSATPSASASTTAATTTTAGGSLAATGSGAGLYGAVAAALLALGGSAAWLGTRRRRAARI